jgi:hypothetical protein
MSPTLEQQKLADDLLLGARAIADELGVDQHAVYYLAKMKRLPIGKLGKNLIASRATLRRATLALTTT